MSRRRIDEDKPLPAASMYLVLALLEGEQHGYALIGKVDDLSGGAVRMGPGTLYGTLNRLLDAGLIVETTDERSAADRRRTYRLTETGERAAATELERLRHLVAHFGPVGRLGSI